MLMWYPGLDPGQKEDYNGKTGEIQIMSGVSLVETYQGRFLSFHQCSMVTWDINDERGEEDTRILYIVLATLLKL